MNFPISLRWIFTAKIFFTAMNSLLVSQCSRKVPKAARPKAVRPTGKPEGWPGVCSGYPGLDFNDYYFMIHPPLWAGASCRKRDLSNIRIFLHENNFTKKFFNFIFLGFRNAQSNLFHVQLLTNFNMPTICSICLTDKV